MLGPAVNHASRADGGPSISHDDLTLYHHSNREFGPGKGQIVVNRRLTPDAPWMEAESIGAPIRDGSTSNLTPSISTNGLLLFYARWTGDDYDLWGSSRQSTSDPWAAPASLGAEINFTTWAFSPTISSDGSTLYFAAGPTPEEWDVWQVAVIPAIHGRPIVRWICIHACASKEADLRWTRGTAFQTPYVVTPIIAPVCGCIAIHRLGATRHACYLPPLPSPF